MEHFFFTCHNANRNAFVHRSLAHPMIRMHACEVTVKTRGDLLYLFQVGLNLLGLVGGRESFRAELNG